MTPILALLIHLPAVRTAAGTEVKRLCPQKELLNKYVKSLDKLWVINSVTLVKIASQNQSGKNVGKYSINVTSKNAPAPVNNFNMIP